VQPETSLEGVIEYIYYKVKEIYDRGRYLEDVESSFGVKVPEAMLNE
jgi:hypothetical protein